MNDAQLDEIAKRAEPCAINYEPMHKWFCSTHDYLWLDTVQRAVCPASEPHRTDVPLLLEEVKRLQVIDETNRADNVLVIGELMADNERLRGIVAAVEALPEKWRKDAEYFIRVSNIDAGHPSGLRAEGVADAHKDLADELSRALGGTP